MSLFIEEYNFGRKCYYICGVPGNYAIKSSGNNRIIIDNILTLDDARNWFN